MALSQLSGVSSKKGLYSYDTFPKEPIYINGKQLLKEALGPWEPRSLPYLFSQQDRYISAQSLETRALLPPCTSPPATQCFIHSISVLLNFFQSLSVPERTCHTMSFALPMLTESLSLSPYCSVRGLQQFLLAFLMQHLHIVLPTGKNCLK